MVPAYSADVAELVASCEGLIKAIARSLTGRGLDFDDLVSEGRVAAVQTVARFDPGLLTPFHSFARGRIRYAMIDAIRENVGPIRVPRRLHSPPPEGKSSGRHEDARKALDLVFVGDHDFVNGGLAGLVVGHRDVSDELERLVSLVDDLPDQQAQVVRRVFGMNGTPPRSPPEVATDLAMSLDDVNGVLTLAFSTLRRRMDDLDRPDALPVAHTHEEPVSMKSKTPSTPRFDVPSANGHPPSKGRCPSCKRKYKNSYPKCYYDDCDRYAPKLRAVPKSGSDDASNGATSTATNASLMSRREGEDALSEMVSRELEAMGAIRIALHGLSNISRRRVLGYFEGTYCSET